MNRPLHSTVLLALAASLAAQQAQPETKQLTAADAWQQALAAAKKHKAPLLVFVVPDDGPVDEAQAKKHRDAEVAAGVLVKGFGRLTQDPPTITTRRELFLRQVGMLRALGTVDFDWRPGKPLVLTPDGLQRVMVLTVQVVASAAACGASPKETVVLLRFDGQRIAGFELDLTDREKFVRVVGRHVLAPDTLEARIANVDPDLARSFEQVRTMYDVPQRDSTLLNRKIAHLRDNLPAVAPAIVGDPYAEIDGFLAARILEPAPPCGTAEEIAAYLHMCTGCGMGHVPLHLSMALKLLGP